MSRPSVIGYSAQKRQQPFASGKCHGWKVKSCTVVQRDVSGTPSGVVSTLPHKILIPRRWPILIILGTKFHFSFSVLAPERKHPVRIINAPAPPYVDTGVPEPKSLIDTVTIGAKAGQSLLGNCQFIEQNGFGQFNSSSPRIGTWQDYAKYILICSPKQFI